MKTKKITKKVLALFISVLMTVALLPIMAQAAISTGLDFQAGGPDEVLKPVLGAQDKNGWGYIAVKATGEGNNDNVICTSNDTAVATVEQNGKNGAGYYKFNVKAVAKGETTITVRAEDNSDVTAEVPVRVEADGIYIEFKSGGPITAAVGASPSLISAVARDGIDEEGLVTCTSDNEDIATVEPQIDQATGKQKKQAGVYWKFDVRGVSKGKATITVASVENPEVTATVKVTVVDELVTIINGETETGLNKAAFDALESVTVPAWSGRNHSFTYKEYGEAVGPTLETVLEAANVDVDALADDQLIQFTPSDGVAYQTAFTTKEILRDKRYYFPNSADLKEGAKATEAQMAGAVEIPTLLCKLDNSDARLVFGQVAPNERSNSVSIKNMTSGGTIEILSDKATALKCDVKADKASGSTIEPGTEIKLSSDTILTTDIYYSTDGSDPSRTTAALYNYRTKEMSGEPDGGLKNATIKAPTTEGTFTLKVMQAAYGSLDSNVVTFTYTVKKPVQNGATYTVSGQSVKVTKPATATSNGAVSFTKAKNAKNVVVPATVKLADGKVYNVTTVGAKAFTGKKIRKVTVGANVSKLAKYALKGSKATKLVVKTKKLKKASVKGSLKGSKVKTVQVKVGKKKVNKKYVKKYKKIFTKKNAGKRVAVK